MKKSNAFERLRKDRKGIFLFNILSFFALFLILELSIGIVAVATFYSQIDKDLVGFSDNVDNGAIVRDLSPAHRPYQVNPNFLSSSRLIVVVYYESDSGEVITNLCSDSILFYLNPEFQGYLTRGEFENDEEYEAHLKEVQKQISDVSNNPIFDINEKMLGILQTTKVLSLNNEEYYFRNITVKIDNPKLPNARYAKVLIMTNSEEQSISSIINISVITMMIVFLMSLFVSYIISGKAIKPIKESLDKQLAFVSDASHELRTPLAIVQSKLENILTKSDSTVLDVSSDIADSLKEISRLNKLSNELLMLARDDTDRLHLELALVNLKDLLTDVCEPFVEILSISDKEMKLELENVECECDSNLIRQLLVILLDNANRYTNSKDQVIVKLYKEKDECVIEVIDTGIGIGEEAIKHVFERFYREDKARSRETGGNGLGLSIARSIVKKHKGTIEASHNHPKGAKFTVRLPL